MFSDKRRGDVYLMLDTQHKAADTKLIRGDRPVVIVSSDAINQNSPILTVIPLTCSSTKIEHGDVYCNNVLLMSLGIPSVAVTRQIRSIDSSDLQRFMGHLPDREMARIDAALHRTLGL